MSVALHILNFTHEVEERPSALQLDLPLTASGPRLVEVVIWTRIKRARHRRARAHQIELFRASYGKPKVVSSRRLSRAERRQGVELRRYLPTWRPETRADCATVARPCPYVSCKHHLYLSVNEETGAIKLNFPDIAVDQMKESCVLDFVDRNPHGATLELVGFLTNVTMERARQIEEAALGQCNEEMMLRTGEG